MVLSASNSYTGGTTINAGTLELANGGSVAGAITNNATLSINRTDSFTLGNAVSGSGALTKSGSGTATLTAASTYTGGTTISAGTLELGNGGSVAGAITNNATLSINRTDSSSFGNVVSGTGALTKSGSGTATLTAANTYSGATTIATGTLQIGDGGTSGAIGSTSGISISNGATLAFNRSDSYGGNFTQTISGSGGVALSAGTLTLQNTANSFTGGVTVNGGTFRTLGNSAGSNIVVNSGGTFAMAGTDTWGSATVASTPAITINAGGTMTSDGFFNSIRDLTLNGGTVSLNGGLGSAQAFGLGGTVTAGGAVTSTIAVASGSNNAIRLGRQGTSESTTFNVSNANGQLLVGTVLDNNFGSISGLTKSGNGKMVLSASNIYSGGTTIS
ncbi:MAG: hypothetical protein EBV34_21435, partial [Betaproteobacteria bacterium]|nr:hypothetical protein [Betaproteobacteria bacterium]